MSMTRRSHPAHLGFQASSLHSAQSPTAGEIRSGNIMLQFGTRGGAVSYVQRLLGLNETNVYVGTTISSVMRFQQKHRMPVSGLVDRETLEALERHALDSATELPLLSHLVKEILKSKSTSKREKITQIWKAFTESSPADYGPTISALRKIDIERHSRESWVELLLTHAHAITATKDASPFKDLLRAVILNDPSTCEFAYLLLSDAAKRSLLDETAYEEALFDAAKKNSKDGELLFMKQLFRIRFTHIEKIDPSTESGSPMWEADALHQAYNVMGAVGARSLGTGLEVSGVYNAPGRAGRA